jgi:hypothetical protein
LPQGKLDLAAEAGAVTALKAFVVHLLKVGRTILEAYDRAAKVATALREELYAAPEAFQAAAAKCRSYAQSAQHADIREDYTLLAQTWERKAALARRRADSMGELFDKDMHAYIVEANLFLERLLGMLDALNFDELAEYDRFQQRIKQYIEKFEYLRKSFRAVHAKALGDGQAFAPDVRARVLAEQAWERRSDFIARNAMPLQTLGYRGLAVIGTTPERALALFRRGQQVTIYRRAGAGATPIARGTITSHASRPSFYVVTFSNDAARDGDFLLPPGPLPAGIAAAPAAPAAPSPVGTMSPTRPSSIEDAILRSEPLTARLRGRLAVR